MFHNRSYYAALTGVVRASCARTTPTCEVMGLRKEFFVPTSFPVGNTNPTRIMRWVLENQDSMLSNIGM